jgi:molybdenum cofactor cytidylyltransferase
LRISDFGLKRQNSSRLYSNPKSAIQNPKSPTLLPPQKQTAYTHSNQEDHLFRIAALILAAGSSRRMGSPKALLPLAGKPMIARVVETVCSIREIQPIVVVTGHAADDVVAALKEFDLHYIHNPNHASGEMLSSVKLGLAWLQPHCDAFFLILGDQPLIPIATYQSLLSAFFKIEHPTPNKQQATSNSQPAPQILQPTFHTHRGHPLLLGAACIPEILSLPPHETLKTFTSRTPTLEIPVDDPGIVTDIDTPEDYDRAVEFLAAQASPRPLDESSIAK